MKSLTHIMPVVAASTLAFATLAGLAGQADAVVEMNMTGSSAGKQFATDVPLDLCDAAPLPHKYVSANGNLIVWTCHRTAQADDIVIRYNATQSGDGILKVQQDISQPSSQQLQLNHNLTTDCVDRGTKSRLSDGKQYLLTDTCNNGNTVNLPVHMGASDTQGGSFGQTGNSISFPVLDDQTGITSTPSVIVPWAIFVGKNVVKSDGTPVTGLSRYQVETIFNRNANARDWRNLGLATNVGGAIEATSPIVVCMRNPGSGSKAGFDQTVMLILNETNGPVTPGANGGAVFAGSSGGVADCLQANPRGIAYLDADFEINFLTHAACFPTCIPATLDRFGDAYMVALEGVKPNTTVNGVAKQNLKCGRYPFWANWRLNRRNADAGTASDTLAQAFITDAGLANTVNIIPTGAYWASDEEMAVFKTSDRGPIVFKPGAHPECQ
jgi:periplasmic binding family protein